MSKPGYAMFINSVKVNFFKKIAYFLHDCDTENENASLQGG